MILNTKAVGKQMHFRVLAVRKKGQIKLEESGSQEELVWGREILITV